MQYSCFFRRFMNNLPSIGLPTKKSLSHSHSERPFFSFSPPLKAHSVSSQFFLKGHRICFWGNFAIYMINPSTFQVSSRRGDPISDPLWSKSQIMFHPLHESNRIFASHRVQSWRSLCTFPCTVWGSGTYRESFCSIQMKFLSRSLFSEPPSGP